VQSRYTHGRYSIYTGVDRGRLEHFKPAGTVPVGQPCIVLLVEFPVSVHWGRDRQAIKEEEGSIQGGDTGRASSAVEAVAGGRHPRGVRADIQQ
jgi:hypothetical protein